MKQKEKNKPKRKEVNLRGKPRFSPGMKGQTELSEFMLKLIATMLFTVFLVGGILSISQFKVQINENSYNRVAIDFGENVLAAPCLAEKKGLFSEAKLSNNIDYWSAHPEDKDGISCLNASVLSAIKIKTESNEWFFGAHQLKLLLEAQAPQTGFAEYEFPAALKLDYGFGDNFESGLGYLNPKNIWDEITSGTSLSTDYSHSTSHSLKIDGSKECAVVGCGVKDMFEEKTGTVSVWFYDQSPSENSEMYAEIGSGSGFIAIGPDKPDGSTSNKYFYRLPIFNIIDPYYFETSVSRTAGWHEFKWVFDGSSVQAFIDGTKIAEKLYGKFSVIKLKSKKSGGADGYFDDFKIESSGKTVPAKLFVAVSGSDICNNRNEGFNCYNCLTKENCEGAGCKWEGGMCKY